MITTSACLHQAKVRPVEQPDPIVGDMRCAPVMSIHDLLEAKLDTATDCVTASR